jgi:hypothetical protein
MLSTEDQEPMLSTEDQEPMPSVEEEDRAKKIVDICSKPMQKKIFFYQTKSSKIGDFLCLPRCTRPHCLTGCGLKSVQDHPNNYDLSSKIYYGSDAVCAPPRFLLYVPGGLGLTRE